MEHALCVGTWLILNATVIGSALIAVAMVKATAVRDSARRNAQPGADVTAWVM